jgi:hypothetical protein
MGESDSTESQPSKPVRDLDIMATTPLSQAKNLRASGGLQTTENEVVITIVVLLKVVENLGKACERDVSFASKAKKRRRVIFC